MQNQDHKDVEIGNHKYRIGRMTARNGSWVLSVLLSKMQGADGIAAAIMGMGQGEFAAIQAHALSVCQRYEGIAPMPIFRANPDVWTLAELEYDLPTVMALTVHAVGFTLSPFFQEGGLSNLMAMVPTDQ